jgi:hypothetical protein
VWSSTGLLAWSAFPFPQSASDPSGFVAGSLVTGAGGDPSWSPTGERIAYDRTSWISYYRENSWIWIRRSDGLGRPRRLTEGFDPHWSPDGRWIAFFTEDFDGVYALRFIEPQARLPRQLYLDGGPCVSDKPCVDPEPAWSPDGTRIAIGTTILNLRTGRVRKLKQLPLAPTAGRPGRRTGNNSSTQATPSPSSDSPTTQPEPSTPARSHQRPSIGSRLSRVTWGVSRPQPTTRSAAPAFRNDPRPATPCADPRVIS